MTIKRYDVPPSHHYTGKVAGLKISIEGKLIEIEANKIEIMRYTAGDALTIFTFSDWEKIKTEIDNVIKKEKNEN